MTNAADVGAELKVARPDNCSVATVPGGNTSGCAPLRSMAPNERGSVVEEFVFDDDVEAPKEMGELFEYGDRSVYQFDREGGAGCPCERVKTFGHPVMDVQTRGGMLLLTFYAPNVETLRDVIVALRGSSGSVDVRRLFQSSTGEPRGLVLVERDQLTDRQREVPEAAHEMGYFDHPRRADRGETATELGIITSTFSEHLAMVQEKLMGTVFQE